MTETTVPAASERPVRVEESFSRYRFDAQAASARTDTPDLMETFRNATAALEAAYRDSAADDLALAELDMAAGFECLPDEPDE